MGDVKLLRVISASTGLPDSIDLTAAGNVLQAENFQVVNAGVTASKPAKLDASKKLTSGDIDLTSEITGVLPVANGGTNSSTVLNNNRLMQSSGSAVVEAAAITASRALESDVNGIPVASSVTATELAYVSGVTSSIQAQLNALTTGFNRRGKVLSYIADNTAVPPTETEGARHILSHDGGAPHANYDGAAANDIVEFLSGSWVASTPVEGWVAYNDATDTDFLQVDDGTPQWENRATAVNDHGDLAGLADDDHSQYHNDGRALTWLGTRSTTDLGEGTNLYYTQARFDSALTAKDTGDLSEGSNLYYTQARFDSAFTAKSTSDLSEGSNLYHTVARAKAAAVVNSTAGSETDQAASVAAMKTYVADNTQPQGALEYDDAALLAGEAFGANQTFFVRWALSGETAGRVYKADKDVHATETPIEQYAFGVIQTTAALSAADPVGKITKVGKLTPKSGDTAMPVADQGKPIFLHLGGAWSTTIPSSGLSSGEKYAIVIVASVITGHATDPELTEIEVNCAAPVHHGNSIAP